MATETEKAIIRAAYTLIDGGSILPLMEAVEAHKNKGPRRFVDCDGDVWTQRENGMFSISCFTGKLPLTKLQNWYAPLVEVTDGD